MESLRKHSDTIIMIITFVTTIVACCMWINGKFSDIDKRFSSMEKDVAIIKTIMFMNGHYPKELAANKIEHKE